MIEKQEKYMGSDKNKMENSVQQTVECRRFVKMKQRSFLVSYHENLSILKDILILYNSITIFNGHRIPSLP